MNKRIKVICATLLAAILLTAAPLTAFSASTSCLNNYKSSILSSIFGYMKGNSTAVSDFSSYWEGSIRQLFSKFIVGMQTENKTDNKTENTTENKTDNNSNNIVHPEQDKNNTSTNTNTNGCSQYASQIASIVNEKRTQNGLAPLTLDSAICSAANIRAKEISVLFDHTRPNGTRPYTALTEAGIKYGYAAENIASGQRSPQAVMSAWMNSPGHAANILSPSAEKIGIGVYTDSSGIIHWVQLFTD